MIRGKCEYCGKEICSKYKSQLKRFCSRRCANDWRWENTRNRKSYVKVTCSCCGSNIQIDKTDWRLKAGRKHFFCDKKCEAEYRKRQREYQTCPICNSKFFNKKTMTCSAKCGYELVKMNTYAKRNRIENITYEKYLKLKSEEQQKRINKKNEPFKYKGREKEYLKEWNKSHLTEIAEKRRKRLKEDSLFRLKVNVRKFINHSFRRKRVSKQDKTEAILGCTFEFFRDYMASKFKEGMSFDNYGKWQIDHIMPLSTAKDEKDVLKLCHYTNLQPLWDYENREKSNKLGYIK